MWSGRGRTVEVRSGSGVQQAAGARALGGEDVVRVDQAAGLEGEAAAADALGEAVAQSLHAGDPLVDLAFPALGGAFPDGAVEDRVRGEEAQHLADDRERHADTLRGADEGDPAQGAPVVAALVAGRTTAVDQPLL